MFVCVLSGSEGLFMSILIMGLMMLMVWGSLLCIYWRCMTGMKTTTLTQSYRQNLTLCLWRIIWIHCNSAAKRNSSRTNQKQDIEVKILWTDYRSKHYYLFPFKENFCGYISCNVHSYELCVSLHYRVIWHTQRLHWTRRPNYKWSKLLNLRCDHCFKYTLLNLFLD